MVSEHNYLVLKLRNTHLSHLRTAQLGFDFSFSLEALNLLQASGVLIKWLLPV